MSDTAGYDESCADQWKSRLDMDKPCGMVRSKETCWLCDDLTAWNREMRALGLELEESRPGMFLLRCSFGTEADSEQVNTFRQASFLASWLLCHHPCIQEVKVSCPRTVNPPVEETPFQIQLRPPSSTLNTRKLRGLYISETCSARLDIRDLEVVIDLETLYINVDRINQHFAAQIDVLMEHNGATLKKVDIWDYGRTGNRLTKFESLVACECLTLMSPVSEASPLCAITWPPNRRVNNLIVEVRQEPDAKVALLCEMLKKNRCIKCLSIRIQKADSAKEIWRALTANVAVNFLCINMPAAAYEEATEAFSDMLSRNNAITGMSMLLEGENAQKFLDSIAKAMSSNRRIVSFSSQFDCRIYVPFSIRESVRRNQCSLNRAVEFVLNRRDDRRGAKCFELFVGTPCMMTHLTKVAGIADAEARLKIVAAKHRIQENYFVLTGIVRRHMVCWPADAKQIDALNAACWRAIASFLRLTDVDVQ
ncbi:hypothetical protein MTO96_035292 [Rhipicephalus appendiculatus]